MKKCLTLCAVATTLSTLGINAGVEVSEVQPPANNNGSFIDGIHPFVNARLRYEYADIEGRDEATLGSLRTRFGIKTDAFRGFKFLAEGEHTWVLTDTGRYTALPPFPKNNRAVIADPDNFELNRLQVSYELESLNTTMTVGRQYLKFADERFIGAVGWRQNDQTYDAVVVENTSLKNLKMTYAYIEQVNRIFGDRVPSARPDLDRFEGESHLIHLEYSGIENHTLRAFAYLLDFDETAVGRMNSSNTYGVELQGQRELSSGNKLSYLATIATQSDAGRNPTNYREHYYRLQIGIEKDCCNFGVGAEVLTGDGVNSFRIPLGTNHKFNGFADAFLATPAGGLVDYYAWIGTKALGFKHKLIAHQFHTEHNSSELGWEVDYVAVRPINEHLKFLFKAAYLDGKGAQRDVVRSSAELNISF